jgi:hypothetical protein
LPSGNTRTSPPNLIGESSAIASPILRKLCAKPYFSEIYLRTSSIPGGASGV